MNTLEPETRNLYLAMTNPDPDYLRKYMDMKLGQDLTRIIYRDDARQNLPSIIQMIKNFPGCLTYSAERSRHLLINSVLNIIDASALKEILDVPNFPKELLASSKSYYIPLMQVISKDDPMPYVDVLLRKEQEFFSEIRSTSILNQHKESALSVALRQYMNSRKYADSKYDRTFMSLCYRLLPLSREAINVPNVNNELPFHLAIATNDIELTKMILSLTHRPFSDSQVMKRSILAAGSASEEMLKLVLKLDSQNLDQSCMKSTYFGYEMNLKCLWILAACSDQRWEIYPSSRSGIGLLSELKIRELRHEVYFRQSLTWLLLIFC